MVNFIDFQQVWSIEPFLARLFAGLVDGISCIFALQDNCNEAEDAEELPVIPIMPVSLRPAEVSVWPNRYKARLTAVNWSESSIEQMERNNRALPNAYKNKPVFRQTIDACKFNRNFIVEGREPASGHFDALHNFCGYLESDFPNTATAESDFLVIGWEKSLSRNGLTDFFLEGIIQKKQFCRLQGL